MSKFDAYQLCHSLMCMRVLVSTVWGSSIALCARACFEQCGAHDLASVHDIAFDQQSGTHAKPVCFQRFCGSRLCKTQFVRGRANISCLPLVSFHHRVGCALEAGGTKSRQLFVIVYVCYFCFFCLCFFYCFCLFSFFFAC